MPEASALGLFVIAALALLLTPGPAVLYIVARSVEQGRLAGFVSDLGIHSATLVHVLAAALGLSALIYAALDQGNRVDWLDSGTRLRFADLWPGVRRSARKAGVAR